MGWGTFLSRGLSFSSPPCTCRNTKNLNHASRVAQASLKTAGVVLATILLLAFALPMAASGLEGGRYKLIRGVITTRDGRPIARAAVEIFDLRGAQIAAAVTGDDGWFEITTDAAPGEYVLLATKDLPLTDERITLDRVDLEIKLAVSGAPDSAPRPSRYTVSSRRLGTSVKVRARLAAAQAHFNALQLTQAMRELDAAISGDVSCSEAFSMRALVKLVARDFRGAAEDARRATLLDPSNPDAYLAQGTAHNSLKEFAQAEQALRRALSLRPDSWQAQLELAKTWYGEKRLVLALHELQSIEQDFPDVHLVRANVFMSLGRRQEGAAEFSAFLREAPNDPRSGPVQRIVGHGEARLPSNEPRSTVTRSPASVEL
jgi:Tfp pilus assembly protein PilF